MEKNKNCCKFRQLEKILNKTEKVRYEKSQHYKDKVRLRYNINSYYDTYNYYNVYTNFKSCNCLQDYIALKYKTNKSYLKYLLDKNYNKIMNYSKKRQRFYTKELNTINKVIDRINFTYSNKFVIDKDNKKVLYEFFDSEYQQVRNILNYMYDKYYVYSYGDSSSDKMIKDFTLKKYENNSTQKLGTEFEIQYNSCASREEIGRFLVDNLGGVATTDCTVDLEFKTNPKSFQCWCDLEKKLDYIFDTLKNKYRLIDYKNDRFTCGGHIHIDRVSDTQCERVALIVEKFKNELKQLSRRELQKGYGTDKYYYCRFYSDIYSDYLEAIRNNILKGERGTHERAVNFQHKHTIELRFWCGFTNTTELLGSLQISNNIDKLSRKNINIDKITINDLLKGQYAKRLAIQVGLLDK